MMTFFTNSIAKQAAAAYKELPLIVNEYESLERKFELEYKKDYKDIYLLKIYFIRLLMLVDNLKDDHRRLLELVLEGE